MGDKQKSQNITLLLGGFSGSHEKFYWQRNFWKERDKVCDG